MSLNLVTPPPFTLFTCSYNNKSNNNIRHRRNSYLILLDKSSLQPCCGLVSVSVSIKASSAQHNNNNNNNVRQQEEENKVVSLDDEVIKRASSLSDATQVVEMMMSRQSVGSSSVTSSDCCRIIKAALECNNTDLALSVFAAMRSSAFDQPPSHLSKLHPTPINENGSFIERWRWPRPDFRAYTTLVIGLAASLRVSDALTIVDDICRLGLSPVEEVPFGKIVKCPSCLIAVAVAQPQQGIQVCTPR